MGTEDEVRALRGSLQELTARVAALEEQVEAGSRPVTDGGAAIAAPEDADGFWALTELRSRLGEHPATADGAVMLVGTLTLPTGEPVHWQQGAGTAGLFELEWSERATIFAALGHPVRIELLRHVLSGTRTTSELASMESLGTTGQLHHHLRQLLATGWLKQTGRGSYEVPAARVVPLLVCLVAVER